MDCIITAQEILTFIPRSLIIPEVSVRLQANHIPNKLVSKYQLDATAQPYDAAELERTISRVKKQYTDGGRIYYNLPSWSQSVARDGGQEDDLTANLWCFRDEHIKVNGVRISGKSAPGPLDERWADVPLRSLFAHIPNDKFPTGQGKGKMTRCLELVRDNKEFQHLTTKDWDIIMARLPQDLAELAPIDASKNLDIEFAETFQGEKLYTRS